MKYFLSLIVVFLLLSCSEDNKSFTPVSAAKSSLCPDGTHEDWSYEFDTLRLHRASKDCKHGFGICSDGTWVLTCVDNMQSAVSYFNSAARTASVDGVVSSDHLSMKLYFPIQLTSDPDFTSADFSTFNLDSNYTIGSHTLVSGAYTPTFTSTQIIVTVPII